MRNEKGFSLIELAIVMVIIVALAAIAIPQFSKYRSRAYNDTAISFLRSAVTCQEAYFTDNHIYTADTTILINQYSLQDPTSVEMTLHITTTNVNYSMTAHHAKGSVTYAYEGPGGAIKTSP